MVDERPGFARSFDDMERFSQGQGETSVQDVRCSYQGSEKKCIVHTKTGWLYVDGLDHVDISDADESTIEYEEHGFHSEDKLWTFDVDDVGSGGYCEVRDTVNGRTLDCEQLRGEVTRE